MLRRNTILTTAAVLAVCAAPASAAPFETLHSSDVPPPSSIAAEAGDEYQDLRSPDAADAAEHRGLYEADRGPYVLNRDYGSPDAVDAGRDLPPVQIPAPVVEVRELPSGGFDWADAGIGAAGMLALFSIAAGSALLISGRKRRRGFRVAIH
ncbi:MAG: hypothetical protein ACRDN8_11505 [Thermoleophilaceae bacterium]